MNYKIVQMNNKWAVIEIRTELIINYYTTRDAARKVVRRLNLGAGFNGWSPPFFTKKEAA